MSTLVLGVDAGGTKTLSVVSDEQGRLLGVGRAGPGNPEGIGRESAIANLRASIRAACAEAGLQESVLGAAFFGLAGIVSDLDRAAAESMIGALGLSERIVLGIDHDCRVALAGGLSGRPGIVLIAGTGSSCFGMNTDGASWLAGGWGSLAGDEGGGYWLAVEALRSAVRAADGRGPATELLPALLSALEVTEPNRLPHRLYGSSRPSRAELAALAPLVLAAAAKGDLVSRRLLQDAAEELARAIVAVADRLGMVEQVEVVPVGGLFGGQGALRRLLEAQLTAMLPGAGLVSPELSPVAGAALLALGLTGVPADQALLRRLATTSGERLGQG